MDGFKFYRSTKSWGPANQLVQAGNQSQAAQSLGLTLRQFAYRLRKAGLR